MVAKIGFHICFLSSPETAFNGHLDGCKIGRWYTFGCIILISIVNYVKYNYFFVVITSWITIHCQFENSQILAQDKLLASKVMISCSQTGATTFSVRTGVCARAMRNDTSYE